MYTEWSEYYQRLEKEQSAQRKKDAIMEKVHSIRDKISSELFIQKNKDVVGHIANIITTARAFNAKVAPKAPPSPRSLERSKTPPPPICTDIYESDLIACDSPTPLQNCFSPTSPEYSVDSTPPVTIDRDWLADNRPQEYERLLAIESSEIEDDNTVVSIDQVDGFAEYENDYDAGNGSEEEEDVICRVISVSPPKVLPESPMYTGNA